MAKEIGGLPPEFSLVPEFPYKVLPRVFDFIVGRPDDPPIIVAALGTLSLLFPDPGYYLPFLLQYYSDARNNAKAPYEALDTVIDKVYENLKKTVQLVLNVDLPSIEQMHEGRGLSESGVSWLGKAYRLALNYRLKDPFFELASFKLAKPDPNQMFALMKVFPPCDAIQEREERDGVFPRDQLASFHEGVQDDQGHTSSDTLRTFQAQQTYVMSHCDTNTAQFLPSSQAVCSCPYYHACHLEWRVKQADICRTAPWRHYSLGAKESCWYTNGVAATMGTVKIKKSRIP